MPSDMTVCSVSGIEAVAPRARSQFSRKSNRQDRPGSSPSARHADAKHRHRPGQFVAHLATISGQAHEALPGHRGITIGSRCLPCQDPSRIESHSQMPAYTVAAATAARVDQQQATNLIGAIDRLSGGSTRPWPNIRVPPPEPDVVAVQRIPQPFAGHVVPQLAHVFRLQMVKLLDGLDTRSVKSARHVRPYARYKLPFEQRLPPA